MDRAANYPAAMDLVTSRYIPPLLGFFLVANTFLVPSLTTSPRATDLLGLLLGLWLLVRADRRGLPAGPLAALMLAVLFPLIWLGWGLLEGQSGTVTQAARWLLAVPWAMALLEICRDETARERLAWGVIVGGGMAVAVVVLQFIGMNAILQRLGLSPADAAFHHYVYHQVRIPGMHGHPNSSSAVISLIAPAVMFLYLRGRAPILLPIGGLLAVMLAMHLTSSRSPLIVTVPVVLLALAVSRQPRRAILLAVAGLLGLTAFLAVFGLPGGAVRWGDLLALQANIDERLTSNLAALSLILEHPLGMGVVGGQDAMLDHGAFSATHNAFLQSGLFFGLPLTLMLLGTIAVHLWRLVTDPREISLWPGLMAAQTAGLFMFEEHLNNPGFVILACWLLVSAAAAPQAGTVDEAMPPGATASPEETTA